MSEYIEKHKVINLLTALENEFQQFKPFKGFENAMYRKLCEAEIAIGKLPAADVVPVVHGRIVETLKDGKSNRFFLLLRNGLYNSNAVDMAQILFCLRRTHGRRCR